MTSPRSIIKLPGLDGAHFLQLFSMCVETNPVAKGDAPVSRGKMYKPKKIRVYEDLITAHAMSKMSAISRLVDKGEGQYSLLCVFGIRRPAIHFIKKQRKFGLRLDAPMAFECTKKPDTDKLVRAVQDALTGVVWYDDSQVVHGEQAKVWSDTDTGTVTLIIRERVR